MHDEEKSAAVRGSACPFAERLRVFVHDHTLSVLGCLTEAESKTSPQNSLPSIRRVISTSELAQTPPRYNAAPWFYSLWLNRLSCVLRFHLSGAASLGSPSSPPWNGSYSSSRDAQVPRERQRCCGRWSCDAAAENKTVTTLPPIRPFTAADG